MPQYQLTQSEKHASVVCSLVVVPKVTGLEGLQIQPTDFSLKSMIEWANLVQVVATGMSKVPFKMRHSVDAIAIPVLEKLARIVGANYCHYCCYPMDECPCSRIAPQSGSSQAASKTPIITAPVYTMASPAGAMTQVSSTLPTPPFQFTTQSPGLFGPKAPTWSSIVA